MSLGTVTCNSFVFFHFFRLDVTEMVVRASKKKKKKKKELIINYILLFHFVPNFEEKCEPRRNHVSVRLDTTSQKENKDR